VNEPELYLLRARIEEKAGNRDEARREVEAALRLFPYSTELREEAGSAAIPEAGAGTR